MKRLCEKNYKFSKLHSIFISFLKNAYQAKKNSPTEPNLFKKKF